MSFLVRFAGGTGPHAGGHTPGGSQRLPVGGSQALSRQSQPGCSLNLPAFGTSVQVQAAPASINLPVFGCNVPTQKERGYTRSFEKDLETIRAAGFEAAFTAATAGHSSTSPGQIQRGPARHAPSQPPVGHAVVATPTVAVSTGTTEGQQTGAPDGNLTTSWPMSGGRRTATPMADRRCTPQHTAVISGMHAPKVSMRQSSQTNRDTMHVSSFRHQTPTPVVMRRSVGNRLVLNVNPVAAAQTEQGVGNNTDGFSFRPANRSVSPSPAMRIGAGPSMVRAPPVVNCSPDVRTRSTRAYTAAEVIAQVIDPSRARRDEVESETSNSERTRTLSAVSPAAVTRSPPKSHRTSHGAADPIQMAMQAQGALLQLQQEIHDQVNRSPLSPPLVTRSPAPSTRSTGNRADQVAALQMRPERASEDEAGHVQIGSYTPSIDPAAHNAEAAGLQNDQVLMEYDDIIPADMPDDKHPEADDTRPGLSDGLVFQQVIQPKTEGLWAGSDKPPEQAPGLALADFLSTVLAPVPKPTPRQTPRSISRPRSVSMQSPKRRSTTPHQTPKLTPRLGTRETSRKLLTRESSAQALVATLMEAPRATSRSTSAASRLASASAAEQRAKPLLGPSRWSSATPGSPGPSRSPAPHRLSAPDRSPIPGPPRQSSPPVAAESTPACEVEDEVNRIESPVSVRRGMASQTDQPVLSFGFASTISPMASPALSFGFADRSAPQSFCFADRSTPQSFADRPAPQSFELGPQSFCSESAATPSGANPDENILPPKVVHVSQVGPRRGHTARRYSEGDASARSRSVSVSRPQQVFVATVTTCPVAADPNFDELVNIIRHGDVLCVNGVRGGINAMARLGANGGFMGHVLLVSGEPRMVVKDSPQASIYAGAWPDESVPKIWLVPTVESTRIEEGLHETVHIVWVEPTGNYIHLGGEERADMIVKYQDSTSSSVEVWQSPPELRSQLRPDLFLEALADLRSHQASWSWSTAVRAFLMSAEVSEHNDPEITMDQIQKAWTAEPICTSVVLSCWQRYLCKIAAACAGAMASPTDALDLILEWMPMRADRTLPGELLKLFQSKGWTTLKQAPKQPPATTPEGSFIRTNSF